MTLKQSLKAMIRLLEPRGHWIKHDLKVQKKNCTGYCLVGAIQEVDPAHTTVLIDLVRNAIKAKFPRRSNDIVGFNDTSHTRKADVLAVLKYAHRKA